MGANRKPGKASYVTKRNSQGMLWGWGRVWQIEGPTRASALRGTRTPGTQASEGEGRPVCLGTVRQEVMEMERQASLPPHPQPQESWKVQAEKCAFHFKKNGKSLESFYPGRCMI